MDVVKTSEVKMAENMETVEGTQVIVNSVVRLHLETEQDKKSSDGGGRCRKNVRVKLAEF